MRPDIIITRALGNRMLVLGGKASTIEEAESILRELLTSGKGFAKWQEMVEAQGGDPEALEQLDKLPKARHQREVTADRSGVMQRVDALIIGKSSVMLGAGRRMVDDVIDPGAGITVLLKPGAQVQAGDVLAIVHADSEDVINDVIPRVKSAFVIGEHALKRRPLVLESVGHVDGVGDALPFE